MMPFGIQFLLPCTTYYWHDTAKPSKYNCLLCPSSRVACRLVGTKQNTAFCARHPTSPAQLPFSTAGHVQSIIQLVFLCYTMRTSICITTCHSSQTCHLERWSQPFCPAARAMHGFAVRHPCNNKKIDCSKEPAHWAKKHTCT